MKKIELKIEYLPIESIEEYGRNTRKHGDYDIDKIKQSIERYGFSDPIGIWSDHNVIVEGHGRLAAAKLLGMTTVPVIRLDHMTDEERRQYGIAHNRTAEFSGWDFSMLEQEIKDLDFGDFDLMMPGIGDFVKQTEQETETSEYNHSGYEPDEYDEFSSGRPDDFQSFDENVETNCKCPRCGFEWKA